MRIVSTTTTFFLLSATTTTALQPPMMQQKQKAVIFDVDGTLVDSFDLGFRATNVVLSKNGHGSISAAEYLDGCRFTTPERLARHAGLLPNDALFAKTGAALGLEFDETYIKQVDPSTAPLVEGMRDLLTSLDGQLGCLTNAAVAYAEAVLEAHGIRDLFGTVHGADSVPKPKPHPDGLLTCAAELAIDPNQCLYIGDSVTDGAAARSACFAKSIGVAWDFPNANSQSKLEESGNFDVVVTSMADLHSVIRGGGL